MNRNHRMAALRDLSRRYLEILGHAWRNRRTLTLPRFEAHEAEFLPAALSIQAQPVSPVGRLVARVLMLLIAVLLLWSVFGKIDIVVVATGKIIPSAHTKTIASVEVASVRAIHVAEGQFVKAGDPLLDLDSRMSDSERDRALGDQEVARLQVARARALLDSLDSGKAPQMPPVVGVPHVRWQEGQGFLSAQWRDYVAKRDRYDSDIRHYELLLPLVSRRAHDYAQLLESDDVSRHAYLEKEQARVDVQGQLADARNQKAVLTAETRRTAQDSLNEGEKILGDSTQDARRAEVHSELLKLVAPVDGTVQQLAVHTIGGVVPPTQPLMQIVPLHDTYEVEASVENKDIGFLREGMPARVKVDAFDYTRYGTTPARVTHVSRDSIEDDKKRLNYSIRVALDRNTMSVDGKSVTLDAGMSTTVEVKTGTRRIIEYVLSPLIRGEKESLHER
ncbi:HlyD family type I secretion periplasmic adaptor subunit [Burkholderia sp. AW33-5]